MADDLKWSHAITDNSTIKKISPCVIVDNLENIRIQMMEGEHTLLCLKGRLVGTVVNVFADIT